jgi:hypothetical protein
VTYAGCCDPDNTLKYCENYKLHTISCEDEELLFCGWNSEYSYYDCGTDGLKDPDGIEPYSCEKVCTPDCAGKDCGPDGCGGLCAACKKDYYCDTDYTCKVSPCSGITFEGCCDPDGTLKYCENSKELKTINCNENNAAFCGWNPDDKWYDCMTDGKKDPSGEFPYSCLANCSASCDGKQCGPDGCGGTCGTCTGSAICAANGTCVADTCGDIPAQGCCEGEILRFCSENTVQNFDCAAQNMLHCGWSADMKSYTCGQEAAEDPAGKFKMECAPAPLDDTAVTADAAEKNIEVFTDSVQSDAPVDEAEPAGKTSGGCTIMPQDTVSSMSLILILFIVFVLSCKRNSY